MVKKLKSRNALSVLSETVNSIVPDNNELIDHFIPLVPTSNTLRVLKNRAFTKKEAVMEEILEWKDGKHKNVITAVSVSPFYVIYRTALQLAWYLTETKKHGKIAISIDATGSVVRPPTHF